MKLPPMLLAATALFWGWQCDQWWIAAALATLFEAPLILTFNIKFSNTDLKRFATVSLLVAASQIIYLFLKPGASLDLFRSILWTPVIFAPFALSLIYSCTTQVDFRALFSLPGQASLNDARANHLINLGYPYFALFILAASLPNHEGLGFFIGLSGLSSWALWSNRPRQRTPLIWAGALLLVVIGGAAVSTGLYQLQKFLEQAAFDLLSDQGDTDPTRTQTSMGHIGQLKLSNSIALRAVPSPALPRPKLPILLMTASYNTFTSLAWKVGSAYDFRDIPPDTAPAAELSGWRLTRSGQGNSNLTISTTATRPTAVLALPHGATRLDSRDIILLKRNSIGTAQADLYGRFHTYTVAYNPLATDTSPAIPADLELPEHDAILIREIARQLHLTDQPKDNVLRIVKAYFANNFTYNLYRASNTPNQSAMEDFLLRNHSGHCEHFATATVLLLRAAGIPARYAIGYSIQEHSRLGNSYIARYSDAHAWTRACVNGNWVNFDTTPIDWSVVDSDKAPFYQPLLDACSWLLFQVRNLNAAGHPPLLYAIGALAISLITRRLIRHRKALSIAFLFRKSARKKPLPAAIQTPSPFHQIEKLLAARGMARQPHEPIQLWLIRVAPELGPGAIEHLTQIAVLHYSYRFGPPHLASDSLIKLDAICSEWMSRWGIAVS